MFEGRIRKIQKALSREKLDAVLISSVSNVAYFSGFTNFSKDEREAYIFISKAFKLPRTKDSRKVIGKDFAYIITDGRYTEAVKREVGHLEIFERGHKKTIEDLLKKHKKEIKRLGIEEDNLTVLEHKVLKKHFKKIKHFDVNNLRSIKKEEISKIEKACKLGDLAFQHILKKISKACDPKVFKAGVSEKEIANELENFIKSKGAIISFPSIVAFGKNSSVPHHQTGETKIGPESSSGQEGLIILLDFGVKFENYCSDMTRTIFLGEPSDKQKRIYEVVLEAQQKAIEFINYLIKKRKEIKAAEVDKVARDFIISKGYPSIPHSLGHGIGLEVHEHPSLSPKSKETLKEGMVFSIEPGIYLENFGGVRIEDLFVLEKNGLKKLTNASTHPTEPFS